MPSIAYIGIGANLGDAKTTVALAIQRIGLLPGTHLTAQSGSYLSAPIDASGDDYINAVVEVVTDLNAHALLHHLQEIELAFGRERPFRNAPRTLDLDLLLYGEKFGAQEINTPTLIIPHPRMTERAFVLRPLLEIAPQITIPGIGDAREFLPLLADQTIRKLD